MNWDRVVENLLSNLPNYIIGGFGVAIFVQWRKDRRAAARAARRRQLVQPINPDGGQPNQPLVRYRDLPLRRRLAHGFMNSLESAGVFIYLLGALVVVAIVGGSAGDAARGSDLPRWVSYALGWIGILTAWMISMFGFAAIIQAKENAERAKTTFYEASNPTRVNRIALALQTILLLLLCIGVLALGGAVMYSFCGARVLSSQ
jgi:hypothetical protein